jgi:hypothetical protein
MQRGSWNDARRCKVEIFTDIGRLGGLKDCKHGLPAHLLVAYPVMMTAAFDWAT